MRRIPTVVALSFITCSFPTVGGTLGVSPSKYIDFIRDVAKATALAKTGGDDPVKFLSLGTNTSGEVVVLSIGVGYDHGTSFNLGTGARAFAHVHNQRMSQKPESADFEVLRLFKIPCFVISADGTAVWEVVIIENKQMYRAILPKEGTGTWRAADT